MATSGGTMMQRPPQPPYSPLRGGPIQNQSPAKRPADNRAPIPTQKMYVTTFIKYCRYNSVVEICYSWFRSSITITL